MTRSSEILPEIREYERTSTAVVNAYVGPAITRYLGSLVERLRDAGIEARLEVMQSSGGTLTPETARPQAGAPRRVRPGRGRDGVRVPRPAHRPAAA